MIIDFFLMFKLSDYLLLAVAWILAGLYLYCLIAGHFDKKYMVLKPKRESDAYIATMHYKK